MSRKLTNRKQKQQNKNLDNPTDERFPTDKRMKIYESSHGRKCYGQPGKNVHTDVAEPNGDRVCTCYTLSSVHIFNVYLTIQFPKGVFHLLTHFNTIHPSTRQTENRFTHFFAKNCNNCLSAEIFVEPRSTKRTVLYCTVLDMMFWRRLLRKKCDSFTSFLRKRGKKCVFSS